jgi:hypothetical protein
MNAIATKARAAAAHCEARKIGYRQSKEGMVVSFAIHPDEMPDSLAVACLGARYMLALVEIGDDEEPVTHAASEMPRETRVEKAPSDARIDTNNSAARERFRALGKPEQMVTKCAMLCGTAQFRLWLHNTTLDGDFFDTEEEAAIEVRYRCGIKSRSELASNDRAAAIWQQMVTDYDVWRGALPEIR